MSQQINLFNPALLRQEPVFTATTMARSLGLLAAGVLVLGLYGQHSMRQTRQEALATEQTLEARKARLASAQGSFAPRARNPEFERQVSEGEARIKALREVAGVLQRGEFGNTGGYSGYFQALARQGSSDLWLTGVSIVGAGRQIGLRGRALEPALVPAYITRLTREPVMQGKSFGSLRIVRAEQPVDAGAAPAARPELTAYVDFSLQAELVERSADVNPAAAPPMAAGEAP